MAKDYVAELEGEEIAGVLGQIEAGGAAKEFIVDDENLGHFCKGHGDQRKGQVAEAEAIVDEGDRRADRRRDQRGDDHAEPHVEPELDQHRARRIVKQDSGHRSLRTCP